MDVVPLRLTIRRRWIVNFQVGRALDVINIIYQLTAQVWVIVSWIDGRLMSWLASIFRDSAIVHVSIVLIHSRCTLMQSLIKRESVRKRKWIEQIPRSQFSLQLLYYVYFLLFKPVLCIISWKEEFFKILFKDFIKIWKLVSKSNLSIRCLLKEFFITLTYKCY